MIYLVDSPIMPVKRIKKSRFFSYKCGIDNILSDLSTIEFNVVFTCRYDKGIVDSVIHNYPNVRHVFFSDSNSLRDFSGYLFALKDAVDNMYEEVIILNSSCSRQAFLSLHSNQSNLASAIVGVGAKSFYREKFKINVKRHIQTFCLKISGRCLIKNVRDFIMSVDLKASSSQISDQNFKLWLIRTAEVGLSDQFKSDMYYLNQNDSLISLYDSSFPVYDSRVFDSRFN